MIYYDKPCHARFILDWFNVNLCLFLKYYLLGYAFRQNTHLRKVNSVFCCFASLATGTF